MVYVPAFYHKNQAAIIWVNKVNIYITILYNFMDFIGYVFIKNCTLTSFITLFWNFHFQESLLGRGAIGEVWKAGCRCLLRCFFFCVFSWVREKNTSSRQIIATSHDLTPNGGLAREIPLFQGNLG